MTVRIKCINKSGGYHQNPHEAISHYGWVDKNGVIDRSDRQSMVDWLRLVGNYAYVEDMQGNKAFCRIRTSVNGTEFLQTYSDTTPTDNLLSLPECVS